MAITELFSPLGYTKGRAWKLKASQTHGLLTLRKRRPPRTLHPLTPDDLGECNYLAADHQVQQAIAAAWRTGSGYATYPFNGPPIAIDKARWNAFAAANDYIKPNGATVHRTGFQWFTAASQLAATCTFRPGRTPDPFFPPTLGLAPSPSSPHANLQITACTYGFDGGGFLYLQPTPMLGAADPTPLGPGVCWLVLAAQVPPKFRRRTSGRASFAVDGEGYAPAYNNAPPVAPSGSFNWYAYQRYKFNSGLPATVKLAIAYVQQTGWYDPISPDFPEFGTPGPTFELTVPLPAHFALP